MRISLAFQAAVVACVISGAGQATAQPSPSASPAPTTATPAVKPQVTVPIAPPVTSAPPRVTALSPVPATTLAPPSSTPFPRPGRITAVVAKEQGYGVTGVGISVRTCDTAALVASLTTGAGGVAIANVALGCYRTDITTVPAGYYVAGPKSYTRTLTAQSPSTDLRFALASGPDARRLPVTLVKKDRVTGAALAGATYSVALCNPTDPNAGQYTATTGPDGTASLTLLPTCYKAVEVAAPAGYLLDATPVYFEVSGTNRTITLLDTRAGQRPVPRDPGKRVPVAEIPSGPSERN